MSPSKRKALANRLPQSQTAFRAIVSKTGRTSVGDRLITRGFCWWHLVARAPPSAPARGASASVRYPCASFHVTSHKPLLPACPRKKSESKKRRRVSIHAGLLSRFCTFETRHHHRAYRRPPSIIALPYMGSLATILATVVALGFCEALMRTDASRESIEGTQTMLRALHMQLRVRWGCDLFRRFARTK